MAKTDSRRKKKLLAIASGGGHWVQLMRLRPAFEGFEVTFLSVSEGYRSEAAPDAFHTVPDASAWNKIGLLRLAFRTFWLVVRLRPAVVISTGAAPGYFGILFGKVLGARTIWVDSIANAEELSLSGQKAGRFADLWLTQWPELARDGGPEYAGTVL